LEELFETGPDYAQRSAGVSVVEQSGAAFGIAAKKGCLRVRGAV
jgi:hypothetical protein